MFVECPLNENKIINMALIEMFTESGQTDLKRFYIDFYTSAGEEDYHWSYECRTARDKTLELLKQSVSTTTLRVEKPKSKDPIRGRGYYENIL